MQSCFFKRLFLFFSFFLINILKSSELHDNYEKVYRILSLDYEVFLKNNVDGLIEKFCKDKLQEDKEKALDLIIYYLKIIIKYCNNKNIIKESDFFNYILNSILSIKNNKEEIISKNDNEIKNEEFGLFKAEDFKDKKGLDQSLILSKFQRIINLDPNLLTKDIDYLKKTFLWLIYIYNNDLISPILGLTEKELLFILMFPITQKKETDIFKTIGMNNIFNKYIDKDSKTIFAKNQAFLETSKRFINDKMAVQIIETRSTFLKILSNNSNNNLKKEIENNIEEISKILKKINDVDFRKINAFFIKNIDNDFFENKSLFIKKDISYNSLLWSDSKKHLTETIPSLINIPFFFFAPLFPDNKGVFKSYPYRIYESAKKIFYNNNYSIHNFLQLGISSMMFLWANIQSMKMIYNIHKDRYDGFIQIKKYIFLLSKLMIKIKYIHSLVKKLYEENRINKNKYIFEYNIIEDLFINKEEAVNDILKLENFISKFNFILKGYFFPAVFVRFYFSKINIKELLAILNRFIGAIDLALVKKHLIENDKFCIPEIIDSSNSKLIINDAWYTNLKCDTPVYNSINFSNENSRNAMIVAPTAGGKTVMLSTIISSLYIANMGIAPASNMQYTYFSDILENISSEYEIGSGLSGNLSERKTIEDIKATLEKNKELGIKTIILIDEMYKGTRADLACIQGVKDISEIIKNENVIFITTTHIPELSQLVLTKTIENIKLYYLQVDEISNGKFINKFKLLPNDINNWWLNDFEKAKRYQNEQGQKLS
jgi:hypothetical protein